MSLPNSILTLELLLMCVFPYVKYNEIKFQEQTQQKHQSACRTRVQCIHSVGDMRLHALHFNDHVMFQCCAALRSVLRLINIVCVCVHVCACGSVCMPVCTPVCMLVCQSVCVYVISYCIIFHYMHVSACMNACMCVFSYAHACNYVYVFMNSCL